MSRAQSKSNRKGKSSLVILSNGDNLYSTQRIREEAAKIFGTVKVVETDDFVRIKGEIYTGVAIGNNTVILPRISHESLERSLPLLYALRHLKFANKISGIAESHNKALTDIQLTTKGVPVVPSYIPSLSKPVKLTVKQMGLPITNSLIVKPLAGTQGTGVFKADSVQQLQDYIRVMKAGHLPYMIQECIPNDGDYRVIVIGGKAVGAMKRSQAVGEHRNNIHKGGSAVRVPITRPLRMIAEASAKALGLGVCGVDVILDVDELRHYVLEVNSTPGIEGIEAVTGLNIARRIVRYCKSLLRG